MADARTEKAATLRSLLDDPGIPEATKEQIRAQLAEWGGSTVTDAAVARFRAEQGAPSAAKETPRATEIRVRAETTASERQRANPFALPEGAHIDESLQGVGLWERMLLKNLAANPEAAARWLRKKGYEAYVYGPGEGDTGMGATMGGTLPSATMRIAVKLPNEDTFKVMDPAGFDVQDLTDLLGDLVFGTITQAGANIGMKLGAAGGAVVGDLPGAIAGGGAGMVAGGAVGGAVSEVLKEEAGRGVSALFGQPPLNENLSGPDIQAQAIGGALAGPVAKGVGVLGGAVAKGVKAVAGGATRLALGTIASTAKMTPMQLAEALVQRKIILKPLNALGAALAPGDLAQKVMQFLTNLDETRTIEYQQAQQLLQQHGTGAVRLKPIFEAIRDDLISPFKTVTTTPPTKIMGITTVPGVTAKVAQATGRYGLSSEENDSIRKMLVSEAGNLAKNAGANSVDDAIHRDLTIPTAMADQLKRQFSTKANYAIQSLEKDTPTNTAYSRLAGELRDGVKATIADPAMRDAYAKQMTAAGEKLGVAKALQKTLVSTSAEEIADVSGGREVVQPINRAEQFFATLLNKGARAEQMRAVEEFGRLWGPELSAAGLNDAGGFAAKARASSVLAAVRAVESGAFEGQPGGVRITAPEQTFGGLPRGGTLGGTLAGALGYMLGGPALAEKFAGPGFLGGVYAASPRGSIQTARVVKGLFGAASATAQAPFKAVGPVAEKAAPRLFGTAGASAASDLQKQQQIQNVDAESMKALNRMAGEVRSMAAKNPNLTQEQMASEFERRARDYMEKRKLALAGEPVSAFP